MRKIRAFQERDTASYGKILSGNDALPVVCYNDYIYAKMNPAFPLLPKPGMRSAATGMRVRSPLRHKARIPGPGGCLSGGLPRRTTRPPGVSMIQRVATARKNSKGGTFCSRHHIFRHIVDPHLYVVAALFIFRRTAGFFPIFQAIRSHFPRRRSCPMIIPFCPPPARR